MSDADGVRDVAGDHRFVPHLLHPRSRLKVLLSTPRWESCSAPSELCCFPLRRPSSGSRWVDGC
jgi:hypothetical protein